MRRDRPQTEADDLGYPNPAVPRVLQTLKGERAYFYTAEGPSRPRLQNAPRENSPNSRDIQDLPNYPPSPLRPKTSGILESERGSRFEKRPVNLFPRHL